MATITIRMSAKVVFHRHDGAIEEYFFRGGKPIECEDMPGVRHTHVLEEPYKSIEIINP
ncbi:hypothetical protein V4889_17330 [Ralstonia solanacearum species complex bacterium KE101]|uniref:hypothetical protein n=1 Tax=Ralstonia solanacearum species complex TaxID=3116862 RepID=UPI000A500307|nr:hypothetical protein [Ralstonia solanacearum]NKF53500.1 hypothetical protein [Ralstonia solanacearum]QKL62806.1 hypothetical protein HI812_14790 [Ralstonia solanacearum]QKL67614.1 hypothetical protein HI808_14795 [Ralstonia solanacearum]QKM43843.1 hypothetical protein HI792_14720 [Ralstonia solanacearum]